MKITRDMAWGFVFMTAVGRMKAHGGRINDMGRVMKGLAMVTLIKDSITTGGFKEKEFTNGLLTGMFTRAIGSMAKSMGTACGAVKEMKAMSVNGIKIWLMAMECMSGVTAIGTRVNGATV